MHRFLLAATAAIALFATSAQAQAVRIGTEGAYAPWNFLNDKGEVDGFEIELGNELCTRAALDCTWVVNAWDTIIPNLLAGNYDVIMAGMSITEERQQTIDFTQPYSPPDPSAFMTLAGTELDYDNLTGKRIGVQGGTIQAGYIEANLKANNTILAFENADQALADLNAGNVDVILADNGYIAEVVAGSGGALKSEGPKIPIGGGVGAGLRKADDELQGKFDAAIAAMKADGTLDALITKWFPEKGAGPFFPG